MIYEIITQKTISWLIKNWAELAGIVFALIMIYLGIIRKWTTWIVGIACSLFYVYINFTKELYALAGLCFYNIIISSYGLYCWKFAKSKNNQTLSFCFITKSLSLKLISASVAIWTTVFFLSRFIDTGNLLIDNIPFFFTLETLITTLSIIASWMTARKIVESWILWIISDVCTIILYDHKGMYLSVFLYVVYTFFAIFGYVFWKKQAIKEL